MNQRYIYWISGALALALVFQLFFRYQYLHSGVVILRVDRLTGASCTMPCRSGNLPAAASTTSAYAAPPLGNEESREGADAIALVKGRSDAQNLVATYRERKQAWTANTDYEWVAGMEPSPGFCPQVVYVHLNIGGNPFDDPNYLDYTWTVDLGQRAVYARSAMSGPGPTTRIHWSPTFYADVPTTCPNGDARSRSGEGV